MNTIIHYKEHPSPLGQLTLAATPQGICGIYFEDQRNFNDIKDKQNWQHTEHHQHLDKATHQLDEYFAGQRQHFDVQLDLHLRGTEFQQAVWQALLSIKFGKTSSYGAHAKLINKPLAVRAVGGAIGRNPISIIVPCHRVLGGNGTLTGYDGGLDRKKYLLQLEGVI
ncbi:methylated-DNA--[protein]-cysteine S-methyltransferase [Solimicrobium silvestre]|uniref:Methylated-DNA--protein-cysteine methyltransferase n=1 Tax=Solimicrobium silvestre TaxID=2099400 RepID=A0A2S9GTX8_9BURK|nr:methylated-DNA--[protein]-cysteine S-methyltransferase [Solimicrobium silvestre]PRC91116.1 ogt: methylated-DNA-[protein]-cysteine S-methyltransferase [Solimicrobium silvestre]